jgi:hypothetical protein
VTYPAFATLISAVLLIEYVTLVGIAWRRAHFRDNRYASIAELVTAHARRVEGPLLTVCLVVALALFVSALSLFWPEYGETARALGLAAVRGALLVGGLYLLGWYWQVRETWA